MAVLGGKTMHGSNCNQGMADRHRWLAAASASALWLSRSAWSQSRWISNPFGLGVTSGSPAHDSVVLWTRLQSREPIPGTVTLRWEVAHDEGFVRVVRSGQVQAQPELAHAVHVELDGLESDRWYFYRFMAGEAISPLGRTRTFPAPDASAAERAAQLSGGDED
jgi:alkaline phosphatase D